MGDRNGTTPGPGQVGGGVPYKSWVGTTEPVNALVVVPGQIYLVKSSLVPPHFKKGVMGRTDVLEFVYKKDRTGKTGADFQAFLQ